MSFCIKFNLLIIFVILMIFAYDLLTIVCAVTVPPCVHHLPARTSSTIQALSLHLASTRRLKHIVQRRSRSFPTVTINSHTTPPHFVSATWLKKVTHGQISPRSPEGTCYVAQCGMATNFERKLLKNIQIRLQDE